MNIGQRVRALREEQGLSGAALARKAGLTRNTVSRIELGHHTPSAATVEKIANALGVGVDKLYPPVSLSGSTGAKGTFEGKLSIEERVHRVFLAARERNLLGMDPDQNLEQTENEIRQLVVA